MGLSGDAKKEFLDNKLFTCDVCLPDQEVTFKAKSALNRHTKRFHTKEALKRRAMSASPCTATNGKTSRLSKSPDVKKKTRRAPATAPVTPATPVTTPAKPKTSPKSEPVSGSASKASADDGNKNPLLKNTPEETASKGSGNRNPLLMNGVSKSSPLKTPLPSGGVFKQPLSTPKATKSLVIKKSANETPSSLPMAFRMNKCNFCQKSFSRESILNVHVEMIHKKEKMELEMKTNEDVRNSSASLLTDTTKEKDEGGVNSSAPSKDIIKEKEKEGKDSSVPLVEAKEEKEECDPPKTSISSSKEEPPANEEIAPNTASDAVAAATANTPTTAAALTNGCEGTESEGSGMESEEEVFMEVEEEDIDLTNHPNLVNLTEKKSSGVVVDKEWKGAYLSRKKADADAPSEENKRISARLRDRVNSNKVAKRKEISRDTPPAVSKKRQKKEVTEEVIKKAPQELTEECLYSEEQWGGCKRKFYSYFSMMRHVAFVHKPERTVEMMRIKSTALPIKNPAMPILMEPESKKSEGEDTAKVSEGAAPESVSSTSATGSQGSSLNDKDESHGDVEQEGSSRKSNGKTEKEDSQSREEVKAVIEEVVEEVVRREAPSSSSEDHSRPESEMQVDEEVSSLSSQGAVTPEDDKVATVADDGAPPKAIDEPNSGGSDNSEDKSKSNGVPDAIEVPKVIEDPKTEDLLDDTVEMEIAASSSEVVVAAAN